MMSKKLRVAQVGVGGFGGYRRERMRETGLFELVAAYDLNPKALAAAENEDGAQPASSFAALLDTPGIEALIIATGAKFHAEQALAAMARGLHVFIEKPLCATPAELRELIAAQQRTGVVAAVGHTDHAHDARSRLIKRMLEQGDFGTIATFEKTTAHSGGLEIKPGDWRGDPDKNPGGMLFQCGVHALHELMFYFGAVSAVFAQMRYDVHTTLTADTAHCVLTFASGLVGTLNAYHVTPYRHSLDIFGTKMRLAYENRAYGEPDVLAVQRRKNCEREPYEPLAVEGESDLCGNLRSFHRAIRDGGTPYPSLIDGARAVAVVFAAEESAKLGRRVSVAEAYPELMPVA